VGFYARLAGNLCSSLPYSVQSHASPAFQRTIRDYFASHGDVDLWHCEWTPYAENLQRAIPGAPFVAMAHNIESLIWQRYAEHERNPAKRWYIRRQYSKFARFERRIFSSARETIAVSPEDAALAKARFGATRVEVVENGVDLEYFRPQGLVREAGTILFLGSLDWRPNQDAVALLLDEIFPRVLRKEPSTRLWLVGRHPPEWMAERARREKNVELHENVPDVRPYLGRCGAMAVPLRIGGGSRLKILEALACSCPVVSTAIGAEGLELEAGEHYYLADSPAEMAEALLKCIANPNSSLALADRGRETVVRNYNWDILSSKLERIWHRRSLRNRKAIVA
jgi:glycosyltransferase involved in cell wall biosynthesis